MTTKLYIQDGQIESRGINTLRSLVSVTPNEVKFNGEVNGVELVSIADDLLNQATSAREGCVALLVASETLPPVPVTKYDDKGKALMNGDKPKVDNVPAIEFVREHLGVIRSDAAVSKLMGLRPALKLRRAVPALNGRPLDAIADTLAYLRTRGLIGEDGKPGKGIASDPVVLALSEGTNTLALRDVRAKAERKANQAAAKKGKAELPFPKREEKDKAEADRLAAEEAAKNASAGNKANAKDNVQAKAQIGKPETFDAWQMRAKADVEQLALSLDKVTLAKGTTRGAFSADVEKAVQGLLAMARPGFALRVIWDAPKQTLPGGKEK